MKYSISLLLTSFLFFSCKKNKIETPDIASLTTVNAVFGGTTARLGGNLTNIAVNGSQQLAIKAGDNMLYVWPVGDSLHPYFQQPKFNAKARSVYSLFLAGTPAAPEGILMEENLAYITDSSTRIRFINLAPNSSPLNITLSTSTSVNEVSNMAYKQNTEFLSYPAKATNAYTFQVRKASAPTTVLASFSFTASTLPRFANVTLVIRQNGSGVAVFRVNNDR